MLKFAAFGRNGVVVDKTQLPFLDNNGQRILGKNMKINRGCANMRKESYAE